MNRRLNLFNNIVSFVLTIASVGVVMVVGNERFTGKEAPFTIVAYLLGAAIINGFLCTLLHELGHLIFGKSNGFKVLSFTVWFFKWTKMGGKIKFNFTKMSEEAGYTEVVPISIDNLDKRYKRMTEGGLIFSFIPMLACIPSFIFVNMSLPLFAFTMMFLPVGAYIFFGNALPMINGGVRNDGAVVYGINKKADSLKVAVGLLKIHSMLYQGKTPAQIEESFYFDLPQLPEDDFNFALMLNARYNYYLDKGDFDNAKKVTSRLLSLEEYLPKSCMAVIKADALYNACTFDYDEQVADDLMYELEKYLNNYNTATNVRVKLAYILRVKGETDCLGLFYGKGIKEADKCQISGLGAYEKKLIDQLVKEYK